MPSGAKKRKAAKKKLHDTKSHHHNHNNNSNNCTLHSQGSDGGEEIVVKSYDGSDGGEETAVKSHDGVSKFVETLIEGNPADSYNGDASKDRKSSSGSSSSDDDEVDVKKEKSVVGEVGDERAKSDYSVPVVGSGENGVGVEVVEENIDGSIPVEETVKEVVLPNPVSDSVPVEDSSVPDTVDSELNQSLNEVPSPSGEKENVAFEVTDLGQEKTEAKEIPVVDNGSGNSSISANNMARDDHVKELEKVKNSEEQLLISSAPLPVRRTSWMNCCGLFEVISGGSGR